LPKLIPGSVLGEPPYLVSRLIPRQTLHDRNI
jgi:hypothetical protein